MSSNLQLESFIFTTIVLMARIIGVFLYAPGFSSKSIPRKFKVILSLALALVLTQYVHYKPINDIYTLGLYTTCELLAGTIIGFTANLFMQAVQIIGGVASSDGSYTGSPSSPVQFALPFSMSSMSCISRSMRLFITANDLSAFSAAF